MTTLNFANETVWIEDNLRIMRGMNSECVDLIYLDPPFNSNRNYEAPIGSQAAGASFKDAWTLTDVDVYEHGELADRNPAAYAVIAAARQAHGKGMMSYLIFMAVRLMEMHRILKETGSIYLHCDPTASHYLKLLMDAIFGRVNFRNEITWKRNSSHNDSKGFGRVADSILFYGPAINTDSVRVALDPDYVAKFYRHTDKRGRYRAGDLSAKGLSGGGYHYDFHGHSGPWRYPEHRMQELEADGRIYLPKKKGGVPCFKRYLADNKGQIPSCIWTDIPPVQGQSNERTGYPTQKPLALLERIIKASSNRGDMVLDPFCGCATTLVAAELLQRRWAGIDLSPLAVKLVDKRIASNRGELEWGGAIVLNKPPQRTDLGVLPNYRTHRHRLYGEQEGVCVGCDTHFPFRVMEVDHILPRSLGGTDHLNNLQLLCSGCNRSKGGRTMAEWKAATRE